MPPEREQEQEQEQGWCSARAVAAEQDRALRQALERAGVLEQRAVITGSPDHVAAYTQALQAVDRAYAARWDTGRQDVALRVAPAERGRAELQSMLRLRRAEEGDGPRAVDAERLGAWHGMRAAVPLPAEAFGWGASPPGPPSEAGTHPSEGV